MLPSSPRLATSWRAPSSGRAQPAAPLNLHKLKVLRRWRGKPPKAVDETKSESDEESDDQPEEEEEGSQVVHLPLDDTPEEPRDGPRRC